MQLVITPDYPNNHQYTFLVYDLTSKKCILKKEKNDYLDSIELANQGRHTFRPFGLTHWENKILVASNNKIGAYNDKNFEYIENLNLPLFINTHQILAHDDTLYVCNTANDSIGVHNLVSKNSYFLNTLDYKLTEKVETPKNAFNLDTHHINSLFYQDSKIYFCLHNKNQELSEFDYLDLKERKIVRIVRSGICCHNIEIIDNILYSLSTKTGQLMACNLYNFQTKYINLVDPTAIFLRGMRRLDNDILIGISNSHDLQTMSSNNCYIMKYETASGRTSKFLDIDDAYIINDFILA